MPEQVPLTADNFKAEVKPDANPLFRGDAPADDDDVMLNSLTGKPWHEDSGSSAEMRLAVRFGLARPVRKGDYKAEDVAKELTEAVEKLPTGVKEQLSKMIEKAKSK